MNENIYRNYTSTSVLAGVDVKKFTAWSHRYFRAFILPHIPADRKTRILEIGCGYGRYTQLITQTLGYENTIGMDISEEQIEYAKKNYGLSNVFCADAVEYLETSKEKFDIIILMDVLEHLELEYAVKLLRKINESLRQNGKLIIQVPNGLSPLKPIFYGDVTHVRPFSVSSMSQILRMAGFARFKHLSLPLLISGLKSFVLRLLWTVLVNPFLFVFVTLTHGNPAGGIYSSNLLTIAIKGETN